jgi:hypothetical protein
MKYPRTPHLPNSPGKTKDDKTVKSLALLNEQLVVTVKMDGSNVCLTKDGIFARSHNGFPRHPSFDLLKQIWAEKRYELGDYEIFGEWLYAKHSIKYENLDAYLQVFNVRKNGVWLSWFSIKDVCEELKLITVPVIDYGVQNLYFLEKYATEQINKGEEGIVARVIREFVDEEFENCVAKYVRKNHVQTCNHWINQQIEKNGCKKEI